ncbi:MAG TPA: NAD(P)/FAD-dependent oxidoreductase [Candidatus Angelobacter sp.]|jgi:phytoene dehydrogenase-like protein|nr:NAD(P)/FAD-dependent oxidoreductase [Candidatus Angelobacter sp.]
MASPTGKIDLPATDAIVVGSGPNGLSAAIRLAQAGRSVVVLEAAPIPGGGVRSQELTLPGYVHDVCSSVYPLTVCSPFFRTLPLKDHGLEWVLPPVALGHPFDDGSAAILTSSIDETAGSLGNDGDNYRRLVQAYAQRWEDLLEDMLAPLRFPRHPFYFAKFGLRAVRAADSLAKGCFTTERGRTFFAGLAAHSMLPLDYLSTAGFGLLLAISAHIAGWPVVRGGAQQLTRSLVAYLNSLGGKVITDCTVESLEQLPPAKAILLDITPRQLLKLAGNQLPDSYRRKLSRYRYGMAAYKLDWALEKPIPWTAPECRRAGTIHLGGSLAEICESEQSAWQQRVADRPFVLLSQPSLFDSSRAPAGRHTTWAYCHVPNGYTGDVTERIESQIERFAPGFRDCILARSVMPPLELERHNPNLVGGDIAGGASMLSQLFLRPTASLYRTPLKGVYLCSSSTPPGAGVHGMCGYFAAEAAMKSNQSSQAR